MAVIGQNKCTVKKETEFYALSLFYLIFVTVLILIELPLLSR